MMTLTVEYTQLFTGRGVFQIDDILTNVVGCVIGLIVFAIAVRHAEKQNMRKKCVST